jgi:hypothetical protein
VGGVRCSEGGAVACFFTGAAGECETFPGDCATNSQCQGTPLTPLCSPGGNCVECLKDADCRQDAGAQGCFSNQCGPCCGSNADCPSSSPWCEKGFCYTQCKADSDCAIYDAGYTRCCAGLCQQGAECGADGGADAGAANDGGDGG